MRRACQPYAPSSASDTAVSATTGPRGLVMFAEYLEHVGQQADAAAEKDEAHPVQRRDLFVAVVRHVASGQPQPEQGQRNVDEENHPPRREVHD